MRLSRTEWNCRNTSGINRKKIIRIKKNSVNEKLGKNLVVVGGVEAEVVDQPAHLVVAAGEPDDSTPCPRPNLFDQREIPRPR